MKNVNKFKKVVVLDSVIFYPEHRKILDKISKQVVEYPSSLPENLEKQYEESPEIFKEKKCYTQIAADNIPLQLLMNRIEGAEVIISCWTNIPDEILNLNPQLKLIIFWTHEKEHRINMKLADKLGITVCNIPDYGTDSVAELVFAGMFEVIKRNFSSKSTKSKCGIEQEVFRQILKKYRLYLKNEKQTRRGQFLHHFHKLGMIKFNITEENLEEIIPEKLIEGKKIGLIGNNKLFVLIKKIAESSFNMVVQEMKDMILEKAECYKFLAENEIIIFDSSKMNQKEIEKLKILHPKEIIDINELKGSDYEINNKILGLVGLGRIGIKVAKMAKEMGLKIVYYSKTRKKDLEKEIGIKYLELDSLLKTSDIISLHLPARKATGLLSKEKLDLLKNKAILINTADGNLTDQEYLTKLMIEKKIFVSLDVYPGLPRKDILGLKIENEKDWKIKNILPEHLLTYRSGWKTKESVRVKTYKLLGNMINYLLQEVN